MLRSVLRRIVVFHSNSLKSMANRSNSDIVVCKHFATKPPEILPQTSAETVSDNVNQQKITVTIDREINLFGPEDRRAPLPGNIGVTHDETECVEIVKCDTSLLDAKQIDLITQDCNYIKQYRILEQLADNEEQSKYSYPYERLECVAHECPKLMIMDFQELFPIARRQPDLFIKSLTVITLCQKTENDMNCWNSEVDEEREEMMEHFVSVSKNICSYLANAGFWADFIDPSSGRPSMGEYTNATMFETDERYRHFGFTLEDLGCCKVISHHLWGTHAFVGALFTNASLESIDLQYVLTNLYNLDKSN